jgi:NDP-sugar pyrophosphorylase family protein
MDLAILAAGESSRMKAEGVGLPKTLLEINGEKIIDRILRLSRSSGCSNIHCIINEEEKDLFYYFRENHPEVHLIVKSTPSSMHSLFELSPFLNESFLLTTSDSIFLENDFISFMEYAKANAACAGTLAITDFIDDEKPLCVKYDEENIIRKYADCKTDGFVWATGGLYYFSPQIFETIELAKEMGISRLRNFLRLLTSSGFDLKVFPFGKIIDVDHASDIVKAEKYLAEHETK